MTTLIEAAQQTLEADAKLRAAVKASCRSLAALRRRAGVKQSAFARMCGVSMTWIYLVESGRTARISTPTLATILRAYSGLSDPGATPEAECIDADGDGA